MGLNGISPAGRPDEGHASRGGRPRRDDRELVMSGARARHAPLLQVEHQALHRDEHAARVLLRELVVEAAQDLVRLGDLPGERAQHGHGDGHEERGRNPLSRHVAQRDDDAVVGGAQHFIEVAANLTAPAR